jgi:hypothetical protein
VPSAGTERSQGGVFGRQNQPVMNAMQFAL